MNLFVFDIETVPDIDTGRKLYDLNDLDDKDVAQAMFALRREKTGSDFLPHYLQKIVAISVVYRHRDRFDVWSLGNLDSSEAEIIERFFKGIEKYSPDIVSWNGSGFDLPVLHYRALYHGIAAPRYWETGEHDQGFRWNNYLNRYHYRHCDLMDVLAGYTGRANAPLEDIACMLGFPGKMGESGAMVWKNYFAGKLEDIRNYCETDVLNTYGVYLRYERMRGNVSAERYQEELTRMQRHLATLNKPHFQAFLELDSG